METITSCQWVNSVHLKKSNNNSIMVKEKIVTINKETSEVLSVKDNLRYIHNPKRTVYITKPEYRTHEFKRDVESLKHLDKYVIEDQYLIDELKKILNLPKYSRMSLKEICNSPYIYHADISMEALIRAKYQAKQTHSIIPIRIGSLDIETNVDGSNVINCITFIAEKNVYTAALEGSMIKEDPITGKVTKISKSDIEKLIHEKIQTYIDTYGFNIKLVVAKNELQLLKWITDRIHEEKVDFITIWNIGFDIPKIIDRIKHYGYTPESFLCHPDVPKDLQYCNFHEDRQQRAHITEKWHWFYNTHYSQFIDAMLLYARVRKTASKEPSYTLDAISTKVLGVGKLKFSEGSHFEMQKHRFDEYVVYNMVDAMLLMMMEWKNHDVMQLIQLTGSSPYPDFAKQTVMLKNIYYKFCLERGKAFASVGKDMVGPYDNRFIKRGGAVLKACLVEDIGLKAIIERPEFESNIVPVAADLDYKAYYPSTESMYALAKENKILTVVGIEGKETADDIEAFMGGIAMPQANSVWLGHDYFGLPSYQEWTKIFSDKATEDLRKNSR